MKPLSSVKNSARKALLGNVTPNLRAVQVSIANDVYDVILIYDKTLSEIEVKLSKLIENEFISDFSFPDYKSSCTVKVLSYPEPIPQKGYFVYLRFEE